MDPDIVRFLLCLLEDSPGPAGVQQVRSPTTGGISADVPMKSARAFIQKESWKLQPRSRVRQEKRPRVLCNTLGFSILAGDAVHGVLHQGF